MKKNKTTSIAKKMGWLGISLCALCCALPIIGTAVGMVSLTVLSVYLEKIGIIALGIATFFFWYAWYNKKKKTKANCCVNCDYKPESVSQT